MIGEAIGKAVEGMVAAFFIAVIAVIVLSVILIGIIGYWAWHYFGMGSYHIVHTAAAHASTFL